MTANRYERHALIDWFDQDLVRTQRLLVVGAGAVGNEVIKNLALLGVGEIHVFDCDVIEVHNLTRSVLFREDDVGRPKAECAAARGGALDPSVRVVSSHGDFWDTLTFSHLESATAVFCCVDNFEARLKLNRLCALAGRTLVNVGIDSRFAVVEHFPFNRFARVPCYECGLPPSAYASIAKRYSCGWLRRIAVEHKKIPTTILTSSSAAALAVSVYLREIVESSTKPSVRYFQDTFTGSTTAAEIVAREGCPGCGDLEDERVILRAQRCLGSVLAGRGLEWNGGPVLLSDRVITDVRCRGCDGDAATEPRFQRADRYDETLAVCPQCGERSRVIGLRDQFDIQELTRDRTAQSIPGKFVMCCFDGLQVVVELEGAEHVGGDGHSEDGRQDAEGGGDDPA